MKWPWQNRETRAASGYTNVIVAALYRAASEFFTPYKRKNAGPTAGVIPEASRVPRDAKTILQT